MGFSPTQGLRSFATSQPPLLVFTICLMAFGLTMVVLAYLIGETELPNPDIRMDWNKFLQKITELDICIPEKHIKNVISNQHQQIAEGNVNTYPVNNATNNFTSHQFVDHRKSLSAFLSNVVEQVTEDTLEGTSYVNISIKVHLSISGDLNALIASFSNLTGAIEGKQLGLTGKLASQIVNISLSFPSFHNISCEKWCHVSKDVCLTLHVPSALLPHTKSPERCEISELDFQESVAIDFVKADEGTSELCSSSRRLNLDYTRDNKLTEMLSIHERSIVNLHLMHTSYFMFVMVMTLLCYALIKGRYRTPKTISMEKVPLDA